MDLSRKEFIKKSMLATAGLSNGLTKYANSRTHSGEEIIKLRQNRNSGIKISVFSKHLQWMNYEEMAKASAQMGFDGVDLTVRPGGHVLPENADTDLPKAVEAVRNQGLEVYTISTAIADPEDKSNKRLLELASQLGIKHYRMGWFNYDDQWSIAENLNQFKIRLQKLAELNEQYGIYGDYQNHSGTSFGAAVWDEWTVLHTINSPWIGSQYDIRHATVEGGQSWPVGLKAMHPYIGTLDIKDFHWGKAGDSWQIKNVPLGQGQVNFDQYFKLLKQYDVRVPITIHNEYDLGGAQHGNSTISIPGKQVLDALQSDLMTLQKWLEKAQLVK